MIVLFFFLMLIICGTADIIITSYHFVETLVGGVYYHYNDNTRIMIRLFIKLILVWTVFHLYFIISWFFFPKFVEGIIEFLHKILDTLLDKLLDE